MINRKLANAYVRRAALKNQGSIKLRNKIAHLESQSEYTQKFLTKPVVQEPPKLEQWNPAKKGTKMKSQGPRRMFFGASIIKNGESWEVKSTHPDIHSAGNFKRREDARNYLRRCVDELIDKGAIKGRNG